MPSIATKLLCLCALALPMSCADQKSASDAPVQKDGDKPNQDQPNQQTPQQQPQPTGNTPAPDQPTQTPPSSNGTDQVLKVEGADALTGQRTGKAALSFADVRFVAYTCAIDATPMLCKDGKVELDLDILAQGSHKLDVSGIDAHGMVTSAVVNFCAQSCDATAQADALATTLQIGDFYNFGVESGFHVTEYSTTKTVGVLSFFRVMPKADPYYLGNYKCDAGWDSMVASHAPAGKSLDYCHSTPTRDAYKDTHEYRLANNHIEIATDAAQVSATNHERISVSIYDNDWEFMTTRSRFKNLCGNAPVQHRSIPMVNDFFYGRLPEEVTFWFCDAIIPARNGAAEQWKIGAFIDIDELDWDCKDCMFDRAVEVVYMARPGQDTWRDDYFARSAQERILKYLSKLQP